MGIESRGATKGKNEGGRYMNWGMGPELRVPQEGRMTWGKRGELGCRSGIRGTTRRKSLMELGERCFRYKVLLQVQSKRRRRKISWTIGLESGKHKGEGKDGGVQMNKLGVGVWD